VIDLYGNPFYAALAQVVETLRHAPYWHAEEKTPSRLDRAGELVRNSRVLLQDERLASVYGSTKAYDVTGFHCTCPQSQKGQSSWCVHSVAVKLARTMAEQGQRKAAPVALGTLRAGTLPLDDTRPGQALPPVSVEERLAQPVPNFQAISDDIERERLALGTMHDATALATHHMPQEDRMPDDAYIPEPEMDEDPVAVLDAPTPVPALRPRTPQVDDLEAALQVWTTERAVVQRFLKQELKANIDYYTLRIGGKESKPSLSKAGAEKVLGWLKIQASFTPDTGTWEMLGKPQDLLCYVCTLRTRSGEIVGEGRGARSLKKDGGDINKAIKMAEKSSMVSAVLRTGALSDVFTQDLEDMQEPEPARTAATAKPQGQSQDTVSRTAQALRQRIWARVQELAPEAKTREEVTRVIMEKTGLALHPDHYADILITLED
jgi:hypothetical protein